MLAHSPIRLSLARTTLRPFSTALESNTEVKVDFCEGEDAGVAIVSLSRPKVNALGRNLMNEFASTLHHLKYDKSTRVIILNSNEKIFCAGADLKERKEMTKPEAEAFVDFLRSTFNTLQTMPQPTIACVDGAALGGGMELALACDLRVSGPNAIFALPETGLAIIPGAGGTQRLSRLVGPSKAKEMIFTGMRLSGEEALEFGAVNRYNQDPMEESMKLARSMLTKGPVAMKVAKIAIDKGYEVDIQTGFALEQQCYAQVIPTSDRLEALAAFSEKRPPQFTGE